MRVVGIVLMLMVTPIWAQTTTIPLPKEESSELTIAAQQVQIAQLLLQNAQERLNMLVQKYEKEKPDHVLQQTPTGWVLVPKPKEQKPGR